MEGVLVDYADISRLRFENWIPDYQENGRTRHLFRCH